MLIRRPVVVPDRPHRLVRRGGRLGLLLRDLNLLPQALVVGPVLAAGPDQVPWDHRVLPAPPFFDHGVLEKLRDHGVGGVIGRYRSLGPGDLVAAAAEHLEELGTVESLDLLDGDAARLTIRGPLVTEDAGHGDSIAVNGCCLTVVGYGDGLFTADVMRETLRRTSLGSLEKELAAAGSRMLYFRGADARVVLATLAADLGAEAVLFNHLYDPISMVR